MSIWRAATHVECANLRVPNVHTSAFRTSTRDFECADACVSSGVSRGTGPAAQTGAEKAHSLTHTHRHVYRPDHLCALCTRTSCELNTSVRSKSTCLYARNEHAANRSSMNQVCIYVFGHTCVHTRNTHGHTCGPRMCTPVCARELHMCASCEQACAHVAEAQKHTRRPLNKHLPVHPKQTHTHRANRSNMSHTCVYSENSCAHIRTRTQAHREDTLIRGAHMCVHLEPHVRRHETPNTYAQVRGTHMHGDCKRAGFAFFSALL